MLGYPPIPPPPPGDLPADQPNHLPPPPQKKDPQKFSHLVSGSIFEQATPLCSWCPVTRNITPSPSARAPLQPHTPHPHVYPPRRQPRCQTVRHGLYHSW